MQTIIFLFILGVNVHQLAGNETSYQMHFMSMTIEKEALSNLSALLQTFSIGTISVTDIKSTTSCEDVSDVPQCRCLAGYRWSDSVCRSSLRCCGNVSCSFPQVQPRMCVSSNTVKINGSVSLQPTYSNCLAEKSNSLYVACNNNVTTVMMTVFSKLKGFDVLTVSSYRVGSIIADFLVIIVSDINSQELFNKSRDLVNILEAELNLQTSGVVSIEMPPNPVCYNYSGVVTCTSQDDLKTDPLWQLRNNGNTFVITNGTQAQVASGPMRSTVELNQITEIWAGEYVCSYVQRASSLSISHRASAVMDVALRPHVYIYTKPAFPHCSSTSDLLNVEIMCDIIQNNDTYSVTWSKQNITAEIFPGSVTPGQTRYSARTVVQCGVTSKQQVTCNFMNRRDQNTTAAVTVTIIEVGDSFCAAVNDWPETKGGATAVLLCPNGAGQRQRECKGTLWAPEVSQCVNQDLYDVLQKAIIVDSGLGAKDSNAASVLSNLQSSTNNTGNINTFPNVNTSIEVFHSLSSKDISINNRSAVNDLLESSNNLLDKSLQNSWSSNNSNVLLAAKYLTSVEQLIKAANVTNRNAKSNIEVNTCNGSQCTSSVFDVNVSLSSSSSSTRVKTAGFQQLQNYLHNGSDSYTPNSIVVSTTATAGASTAGAVEVTLVFPLLRQRPRNVEIICVYWDDSGSRWSQDGCRWVPSAGDGHCVCTHLSSFAALMSTRPKDLPGSTEMTYAGLSVSIVSLVAVLAIELTVWSAVVKTNTLYLRHTTHVNISLCLLIADSCFLASSVLTISDLWCETFVVLKHFCYLSMFFWMLCLSVTLLHQAVFLFHSVSKKNYLRFSLILGYVCPFLIVFITFLTNQGGAEGSYFNRETCWLVYVGLFKGTIFTFLIPVGIIIFINVFSMLVVIMKLLDHPKNTDKSGEKDKTAAKTVMRTVVLLTPIFGITWAFGFGVMILDLTSGPVAYAVNYAFILTNSFQGFFILITTCLGDKMIREALLKRFRKTAPGSTTNSESTTKLDSTWKK